MSRLKILNDEYTKAQLRRIELSVALKSLREAQEKGQQADSLLSLELVRSDSTVKELHNRLRRAQQETRRASRILGPGHPELLALEDEEEYLQSRLREAVWTLAQSIRTEATPQAGVPVS